MISNDEHRESCETRDSLAENLDELLNFAKFWTLSSISLWWSILESSRPSERWSRILPRFSLANRDWTQWSLLERSVFFTRSPKEVRIESFSDISLGIFQRISMPNHKTHQVWWIVVSITAYLFQLRRFDTFPMGPISYRIVCQGRES